MIFDTGKEEKENLNGIYSLLTQHVLRRLNISSCTAQVSDINIRPAQFLAFLTSQKTKCKQKKVGRKGGVEQKVYIAREI
jgi:hypothetical protein